MIVGVLIFLAFVGAQGAIIVSTAGIALQRMGKSHWLTRILACVVSYIAWIAITIIGYILLGGEGGLMDGFGAVLDLCFTALVSTLIMGTIWIAAPLFGRPGGASHG